MPYPSFPRAVNHPVFLDAFDPSFMGGQFPSDTANAFSVLVGGLASAPVRTSGGSAITTQQFLPLAFAWAGLENMPIYFAQRFGMNYAMVNLVGASDGGGT